MHENPVVAQICAYLKNEIMVERLKDDQKISERAITAVFPVSRTIVREALQILKKEGWLYSKSKSGTYVAPPDSSAIYENYQARLALEGVILMMAYHNITAEDLAVMRRNCDAMRNAQTKADYSFAENSQHSLICERSNNRYIIDFINGMMDSMVRIGIKAGGTNERRASCVNEWIRIIDALEAGDPYGASRELTRHIQRSMDAYELYYRPLTHGKHSSE